MVVGVLTLELHFPASESLKEKRHHLKRILGRLRQEFNLSVAEVGHQELWQRSLLSAACVNTSGREAEATLAKALNLVEAYADAEVISHAIEMR